MIAIAARCMAIALTCKTGASGSWRLGGTMVTVFYVFVCVLCVVVEKRLVLGVHAPCNVHVCHKYFYRAIFFPSILMLEWY